MVSTLLIVTSLGKESLSTPGPGFCSRATSRPATRGTSACWARQGSCVPGTAQRGADTEEQTAPTDRAEAMCVPTSPPGLRIAPGRNEPPLRGGQRPAGIRSIGPIAGGRAAEQRRAAHGSPVTAGVARGAGLRRGARRGSAQRLPPRYAGGAASRRATSVGDFRLSKCHGGGAGSSRDGAPRGALSRCCSRGIWPPPRARPPLALAARAAARLSLYKGAKRAERAAGGGGCSPRAGERGRARPRGCP